MVHYALWFAVGILSLQTFAVLPAQSALAGAAFVVIVGIVFRYWRLVFYAGGFLWAAWIAQTQLATLLSPDLENQDILLSGVIVGLPRTDARQVRFDLLLDKAQTKHGLPDKIRISWFYPDEKVQPGQRWRFNVRLKRPHGNLNPGGFDYEKWLFRKHIGATGYVRKKPPPLLLNANAAGLFNIDRWRQHLSWRISAILKNSPMLGFVQALIIGDRQHITEAQWTLLRTTGTVHLFAISGLHIGLIAGLVYFISLRLWAFSGLLTVSPPTVAALCALGASCFYALLAGFSLSTLRALIMLSVVMLAIIWRRHSRPVVTIALAFFIVLLFDPLAVLTPGFWLSFAAVALIFYVLHGRQATDAKGLALLKINSVTSIGLMPLLLLFFQQASLLAPLANFIAVPLMSFVIVPLVLLTVCVLPFHQGVATVLFQGLEQGLRLFYSVLQYFGQLPFISIQTPAPGLWIVLLATAGALILLMPRGLPGRHLGVLLMAPLFFTKPQPLPAGSVRLTMLDVGQGLSVVVQTQNHVLLYDTGTRLSEKFDMGKNVVLPFLRYQGRKRIDTLLISHGDIDHIGGAASVMQAVPVGRIISSIPEKIEGRARRCQSGQSWVWDRVRFRILGPPKPAFISDNDNSCVLQIISASGRILLTGDIERRAEQWLVQTWSGQLQADILVAPHHGSDTSSSESFLAQVQPRTVLISAGYKNRFKHPHNETLMRYRHLGIQYLNTARQGAIDVFMENGAYRIQGYRNSNRHYWNWPVWVGNGMGVIDS